MIKIDFEKFIGHQKQFSLEERIYHIICFLSFFALIVGVVFSFLNNIYAPAFLCLLATFLLFILYYLSRKKRKSALSIILFSVFCNVFYTLNYFYNSGINGPNLLSFATGFLLIMTIIPKKQFKIWIFINSLIVVVILIVEYYNPEFIPIKYENNINKLIDSIVTYLSLTILMYYILAYIRENYNKERVVVENQRIKLENLNTEKDKLLSIVSHDVRSPLNTIQGYLENLDDLNLNEEERTVLRHQLLDITRETSIMLNNLLSWSKSQMEGSKAKLIKLEVKSALTNALKIKQNVAARKEIQLTINCDENIFITADHDMFELIIRNLISNAIKFTNPNGLIKVNVILENEYCVISVSDNGLGMDEELQKNLFKLNAKPTYGTNNERGVGLGLLLCKEFIDLQGGFIRLESKLGNGSKFFVSYQIYKESSIN